MSIPMPEKKVKKLFAKFVKNLNRQVTDNTLEEDKAIKLINPAKKLVEQILSIYQIYQTISVEFQNLSINHKINLNQKLSQEFLKRLEFNFDKTDFDPGLMPHKPNIQNRYTHFKEAFDVSNSKLTYKQIQDKFWDKIKELESLLVQN
jgi:hypothetical protein